jgi:hypothetical protein
LQALKGARDPTFRGSTDQGDQTMAKNLILWMLGVPISVLILLNIFGFL